MGVRLMAVRAPAGTTMVPVFSAHAGEMEDSAFKGLGKRRQGSSLEPRVASFLAFVALASVRAFVQLRDMAAHFVKFRTRVTTVAAGALGARVTTAHI